MAQVVLKELNKKYDEVHAVKDVNLTIRDKEFMVLVGPSGCGKTTTLRMVAGLEEITAGRDLHRRPRGQRSPPKDRDIALVFQNYALYPPRSGQHDGLVLGACQVQADDHIITPEAASIVRHVGPSFVSGQTREGEEGRVKPDALILMPAFGAGLTFCAHLVRWGDRVAPLGQSAAALPPCTRTALEMVGDIRARKTDAHVRSAAGLNAPALIG